MSTTSPNSTHADGSITHLDVHNLWGLMEEQATYNMFREYRPNERPFLISRSTFPGSGKVTGHWLGTCRGTTTGAGGRNAADSLTLPFSRF